MASIQKLQNGKWRAQVRVKGQPSTSHVGATKAEVTVWARDEEARIYKLLDSNYLNTQQTFSEVLAVYRQHSHPGGVSKQRCLRVLEQYFGTWTPSELTTGTVSTYARKRRNESLGPASLLQELTYLASVLRVGGALAGSEAATAASMRVSASIKAMRTTGTVADAQERTRRPTEQELLQIRDWLGVKRPHARPDRLPLWEIALFAICTCMRQGEISRVRFEHVDEGKRLLFVPSRKDPTRARGRDMWIPLLRGPVVVAGEVVDPLEILKSLQGWGRPGRLFPHTASTIKGAWRTVCRSAGVADLHFHDLRHEGVSRLFEAGYSIPQVAAVSGHKSWRHLQRYTQIDPASLHMTSIGAMSYNAQKMSRGEERDGAVAYASGADDTGGVSGSA